MSMFEKVENEITKASHSLGADLIEFLSSYFFEEGNLIEEEESISVDVVLDTNILYEAVRGKMLQGSCFLEKLLPNPMINFIAPEDLKKEIIEVVPRQFIKDKKTKNIDTSLALEVALSFLDSVTIVKEIEEEYVSKAYDLIGNRDPKDVNFLALHLQYNTQAIVAKDRDYEDADVKVWRLGDVGKVVTVISNGRISLCLSNFIGPKLYLGLFEVLSAVIMKIFTTLKDLVSRAVNGIINNPGTSLFFAVVACLIEKDTQMVSKSFKRIKSQLKLLIDKVVSLGEALGISIITLVEVSEALNELVLNANEEIFSLQKN